MMRDVLMRTLRGCLYAIVACVGLSRDAVAQFAPADSMNAIALPNSRIHDFQSAINGQPYRLGVVLPKNYLARPASRYPVLYVLDGEFALVPVVEVYQRVNRASDSLIIVGVGFSDGQGGKYRAIDYSLPLSGTSDTGRGHAAQAGACCQAAKTLRVLREEIIPLIDRLYRTTSDRGLMGHSWSANFAAYALVTNPDVFERYAITSPSPWTDNDALFELEAVYAQANRTLKKRVFISVGADEGSFNRYSAARLAATLRARDYEGLDITSVILPDAYHTSGQEFIPALRTLYPPKQYAEVLRDSARRTPATQLVNTFLAAYAHKDTRGVRRTLADGEEFQGIVAGKLVKGPDAYVRALEPVMAEEREFHLDTLHVSTDAPYDGSDAPGIAVVTAAYTAHPGGRQSAVRRTLAFELKHPPQGWRITYVLHPSDVAARVTIVRVESNGLPVANAEVVAEWDAGPFSSARTDSSGIAFLPFDWHVDWLRAGHLLVRARGFQPAFVPAPTKDSVLVMLKPDGKPTPKPR